MKNKIKKISIYFLAVIIIMESIFIQKQTDTYSVENGIAKRDEAIAWLEGCQNENGSWGSECSLRDTCEVLKYAKDDWFSKKEVMGDAKEWGKSQKASNFDDIYRINSINESEQNSDITEVTALQNVDGGWSLNENYASDVFDTLLALEACINADELHSDTIKKGVAYIMLNQMDNGAFSYADEESNVYLTAYATYVMEDYIKGIGRNDESAKIALAKADEYLISREDASSLWGLDEKGMIATLMSSIVLADDDIQKTCERIEIIAGVVDADGSVYGSPVLTAMFVSLVDSVSEAKKTEVEITDLYIYIDEILEGGLKTTQELVKESTCSMDELYRYLLKNADEDAANAFIDGGKWPEGIQIPKNSSVLNADGTINWSKAPKGGYVLDVDGNAIKEKLTDADKIKKYLPVGKIIDRYGDSGGRYVSPVNNGVPYSYDQRSLPYIEDVSNYHQYEVIGDFSKLDEYILNCTNDRLKNDILSDIDYYYNSDFNEVVVNVGEIAKVDGWGCGGGIQYEFPIKVKYLEELGLIREIK